MKIDINILNVDKVTAFLRRVPAKAEELAQGGVAEYLIGDETHGLKHYPPYKHVPTAPWWTDKQRRYVMERIREGSIIPGQSAATGAFRNGWHVEGNSPDPLHIVNNTSYGPYLVGNLEQTIHSEKQGWRKIAQNIEDNIKGAIRHALAKINEWLNSQ